MRPSIALTKIRWNGLETANFWLLCFIAVSPSLGTALAALGRLVLLLSALVAILLSIQRNKSSYAWLVHKPVTLTVLFACIFYATSTLWTLTDAVSAWWAWSKYARILTIPLIYYLIPNPSHGLIILRVFILSQVFVGLSSWLLIIRIHPAWISSVNSDHSLASFGTYLEESIAQAAIAGILWFKRDDILGSRGKAFAVALAGSSAILTLFFLQGRTGYIAMLGIFALASLQLLPKKLRLLTILVPILSVAVLFSTSTGFHNRSVTVYQEVIGFYESKNISTSGGTRLQFWAIALKGITAHPFTGVGAGGWKNEYQYQTELLDSDTLDPNHGADDPHQLFLLWGVEGGILGLSLLIVNLIMIIKHSCYLTKPDSWALGAFVLTLALASMFNSVLHGIGLGDFFCVGIGILLSLTNTDCEDKKQF